MTKKILALTIFVSLFSFAHFAYAEKTFLIEDGFTGAPSITPAVRVAPFIQTTITATLTEKVKKEQAVGTFINIRYIHPSKPVQRFDFTPGLFTSYEEEECPVKGLVVTCELSLTEYGAYVFQIGKIFIPVDGKEAEWTTFWQTQGFNIRDSKYQSGYSLEEGSLKATVLGGNSIKVTGKVTAATLDFLNKGREGEIKIVYGPHKDSPGDAARVADLSKSIPVIYDKTSGTFSTLIPDLEQGRYVIGVKLFGYYAHSFLDNIPVSGNAIQNQYQLLDPIATGGDATNGFWADPKVQVTNPEVGDYQVQLGYARPLGTGDVRYECVLNDNEVKLVGPKLRTTEGQEKAYISNTDTFKGLSPGLYCVGMKYTPSGGKTAIQAKVNPPDGISFLITSVGNPAIIPVGGVKPPTGATLDETANGNGCSTSGADNTTYCLLAPLPGVGDESGKIDVTKGIGDYINTLIRLVMGLIGVLSVLMIVIGGVEYMSTVNIGEKEGAKDRITNALFGLILALASYLILNTINPRLVNLSVVVQRAEIGMEEADESGGLPGDLPPTGITPPPTVSAQAGALAVLNSPDIILMGILGTEDARSTAKQNVTDTSEGRAAWTTATSHVGAIQVALDARIFTGMRTMARYYPIQVNYILGGSHSSKLSRHYAGRSFDVQAVSTDTVRNTKLMDACRAAGADEIIGPCSGDTSQQICKTTKYRTNAGHQTHIHCAWR